MEPGNASATLGVRQIAERSCSTSDEEDIFLMESGGVGISDHSLSHNSTSSISDMRTYEYLDDSPRPNNPFAPHLYAYHVPSHARIVLAAFKHFVFTTVPLIHAPVTVSICIR